MADTEGVRKGVVWPTLTLSMIITVAFVVTAIGTYECIACGASTCDTVSCVVSPCTIFLAIVIWLSAASAVSLSGETELQREYNSHWANGKCTRRNGLCWRI